jgi:hypothetical protein
MDRLIVQTRFGPLPLVGRLHSDKARPCLLVIGGAFPPPDFMHEVVDRYPEVSVLVGSLPGMRAPSFDRQDVSDFAGAYDEALGLLAPSQPVVACGVSTGCLVTLGLRSPNICSHLLQEPFFSTADLWPFIAYARDLLARNADNAVLKAFLWDICGVAPDAIVDRDYWPLLEGLRVPTDVIIGEMPLLPQRELPTWPSFTTEADRVRLRDAPLVTLHLGPPGSGHNLTLNRASEALIGEVTQAALNEARSMAGGRVDP